MSASGRAMLWNAHCRIPSHVLCGTCVHFLFASHILRLWVFQAHPCVTHSPMLPCEPHQRHGPPWMGSACWCHTESYLTQQRIELVPTQHRFTAEGSILCLRVGRCPASCPAALSLLSFCSGPLLMFSPSPGAVPAHAPPVQLH